MREPRRVSQQRRGAKRQSGFMIFSQRHFSRDTLPKNDERAQRRIPPLMSRFLRALRMMHRRSQRAPCSGTFKQIVDFFAARRLIEDLSLPRSLDL